MAYEARANVLIGAWPGLLEIFWLLLLYFIGHCINIAIMFWYADRHGNIQPAGQSIFDGFILALPLGISLTPVVQREYPAATIPIIISGTLVAALIVVMRHVFKNSAR